jgi:hypothetical protein
MKKSHNIDIQPIQGCFSSLDLYRGLHPRLLKLSSFRALCNQSSKIEFYLTDSIILHPDFTQNNDSYKVIYFEVQFSNRKYLVKN